MPGIDDIVLGRTAARRPAVRCTLALGLGAILLSGCAQNSAPEPIHAQTAARRAAAPICQADPALLAPQSAPDCVFRRAELKTIDPDQWARLKIEYERQCYQKAERTVRERLNRLQGANRCEG